MSSGHYLRDPIQREPAWLTAAVDQDIQRLRNSLVSRGITIPWGANLIMMMLNEYSTKEMSEAEFMDWNQTCDGCHQRFDQGIGLVYAHTLREWNRDTKIAVTFAACPPCLAKP